MNNDNRFDREESDRLFIQMHDYLNEINANGKLEYSDYCNLHDGITRLYDSFSFVDEIIVELQAQLAKERCRAEKALGYIKKIFGCDECVHDDDETNYETCKSCNIYDKWQWRRDVEEGD